MGVLAKAAELRGYKTIAATTVAALESGPVQAFKVVKVKAFLRRPIDASRHGVIRISECPRTDSAPRTGACALDPMSAFGQKRKSESWLTSALSWTN